MRKFLYPGLVLASLAVAPAQDAAPGGEEVVTFKSEVALVRVDAQVLNRDHRALNNLQASDFVIRDGGQLREVRNFAQENLPVDVLFLIDVSGSMRPHVERMAAAAQDALRVMGADDRFAIMVFDRASRIRMRFSPGRRQVQQAFDALLFQETFDGGTDITRGLLDAAGYVERHARPQARRAIVILTDDQTQREREDLRIGRALTRADAVLSALITPNALGGLRRRGPAGRGGGGGWPQGGGGLSLPGGIILGRGGNRGPVILGAPRTQSAGTPEIARQSGGDSLSVDDAEALEVTLSRIRQRYALYFQVPPGVQAGEERQIEVSLASATLQRHPGAEVLFRRTYIAPSTTSADAAAPPVELSQAPAEIVRPKRRPGVLDESRSSSRGPLTDTSGGWQRVDGQTPPPAASAPPVEPQTAEAGGWRRLKPGEKP